MNKSNKGMSLVELLIAIAVVALTTPLILWVLAHGVKSYSSYNRYIEQQYRIMEVTRRIRQDVEEAAAYKVVYDTAVNPIEASVLAVWIPDGVAEGETYRIRCWRAEGGRLLLKSSIGSFAEGTEAALDGGGYEEILDGLDTATVETESSNYMPTRFEWIDNRILLSIMPEVDAGPGTGGRNVSKPVVTEFSVRYKEKIY